jgi:vacuolar protein sorting-associated protein 29
MGVLVLVMGDFHIPHRGAEIPAKYREMITPNKINTVICTGNMGSREVHDWAKSLSNNFHVVKGDFEDEGFKDLPEEKVVEIGGLKMGIIHGHQIIPWGDEEALGNKAIELGVSVLISGHSHELKFSTHNGINFINPGSMTGAFSTLVS